MKRLTPSLKAFAQALIFILMTGCSSNRNQFVDSSSYGVQHGKWLRLYDDQGYIGSVNTGEPIR